MKNRTTNDVMFTTCATCTVLLAAAAFAALIYEVITAAVPLLESMMSQRLPMMSGF